jgi:hypothetical protein
MTDKREWWVIYDDDPRRIPELLAKGELRSPDRVGFVSAAKAGSIGERRLAGMYIIDPGTPRTDVIATYGLQPPGIGLVDHRTLKIANAPPRTALSRRRE